jgi:hypothetical protein
MFRNFFFPQRYVFGNYNRSMKDKQDVDVKSVTDNHTRLDYFLN